MAVSPKTIYLEADEEVTSVIDKIRKTEFTDVVLVVPKGASLSQSVVNLKLIKKKASELSKNVSIITQDKVALNLAEKVGLLAASSAEKMPEKVRESVVEQGSDSDEKTKENKNSPLEETSEVIFKSQPADGSEPGELKVVEGEDTKSEFAIKEDILEDLEEAKDTKKTNNLMPKLPYAKLGIAVFALLLILGSLGFVYLPRARAVVALNSEEKAVSINISGEKDAKLDLEKAVIPTKVVEAEKESSKKFPATGKKDVGTKATGEVRIFYNAISGSKTWAAGTRIYPKNKPNLVYRITNAATFNAGEPIKVSVQSDAPGDQYNGFAGEEFVATNDPDTKITLTCVSEFTGGLAKQVSVVTEGDINAAKDNLAKEVENDATAEFNKKYGDVKIVEDTKKAEVSSAKADPSAGNEGSEFNLTIKVTIKALAFSVDDVSNLVKSDVERQLGFNREIIDSGASSAEVEVDSADLETGKLTATVKAKAFVSNKLDQEKLKDELIGLNATKAENYLKGLEGVSEVRLEFWPSFIKLFPRVKNHIYIVTQVAEGSR
jgi:hypothetical protein